MLVWCVKSCGRPLSVCEFVSVPYVDAMTVMHILLFVLLVSMVRECEDARVTAMLVWRTGEGWLS